MSEPAVCKKNQENPDVYDCEYYPLKQGNYTVDVQFGGKSIPKSPFLVGYFSWLLILFDIYTHNAFVHFDVA